MALLFRILINIRMLHVNLIILMITYFSSLCFSSILETCRFHFLYYRCWGTDFLWWNSWSDCIWKCTDNFPLVSFRTFHKVWYVERTLAINMLSFRTMANIPFDTSCQRFWIHITKIHVNHIHKNTIISDEHTVSLQSSMQFLPIRLPIIVLQSVANCLL